MQFWAYDPTGKAWHVYGKGQVSADAKTIEPEPGLGFYQFTGFSYGLFGSGGGTPGGCGGCCGGSAGGGSDPGSSGSGAGNGPGDGSCGDPVLLSRGTFQHSMTDLTVSDILPIALDRTFMDKDGTERAFGIGMMHRYDMNLTALAGTTVVPIGMCRLPTTPTMPTDCGKA